MDLEKKENYNFKVEAGVAEVIIRHGEAEKIHVDRKIIIENGAIGSVQEYLSKEGIEPEQIKHSLVSFSYEDLYLNLGYAVRRLGGNDEIKGILKLHPELEKWKINKTKAYTNHELASFIKMNRHFFENREIALSLVTTLQGLQVKVAKEIESADNKRGDYREVIGQKVIESNLPDSFILKLPVFVGQAPVSVQVEIEVSPTDFGCTLISPQLKEIIDIETRAIIDTELDAIRKLYPELKIFQK